MSSERKMWKQNIFMEANFMKQSKFISPRTSSVSIKLTKKKLKTNDLQFCGGIFCGGSFTLASCGKT